MNFNTELLGMWRSSNSNSTTFEYWPLLAYSIFVEYFEAFLSNVNSRKISCLSLRMATRAHLWHVCSWFSAARFKCSAKQCFRFWSYIRQIKFTVDFHFHRLLAWIKWRKIIKAVFFGIFLKLIFDIRIRYSTNSKVIIRIRQYFSPLSHP